MFTKNSIPNGLSVKAYRGDAKTLLAFDLPEVQTKNLAGFTIACEPPGKQEYYLLNQLILANSSQHARVEGELPTSSVNSPFQKFFWVHVPGSYHQDEGVIYGLYKYTVTPRYFDEAGSLQKPDSTQSVSLSIRVEPFSKGAVELGFTRGFVHSQAFVHHFGQNTPFKPAGNNLQFDTGAEAGKNNAGQSFTFLDEYTWSGFTAREKIFSVLNKVADDPALKLDVFAYDLNEPDVIAILIKLAEQGRIRIILDSACLHHSVAGTLAEDQFEDLFRQNAKGDAEIKRGKFGRFSHDKILIVNKKDNAVCVLIGSTNFSVAGMYVNSKHVILFNDETIAQTYADVFDETWKDDVRIAFRYSSMANRVFSFGSATVPKTNITFSPHQPTVALSNLQNIADRINKEKSSVLFAVMALDPGTRPILEVLKEIHANPDIFSYGISDSTGNGISLYKPGNPSGVLVSGKPGQTKLPPPFDKEEPIAGIGHQIHHKFVICDFNGSDAITYCGSSNLAEGGEEANGDNLLAIFDQDISTVFAIEAFTLVDHFNFRDKFGSNLDPAENPTQDAEHKPMTLCNDDSWTKSYYTEWEGHCKERVLLA